MKKENKRNLIIYLILFFITCLIFLPFLMGHYSPDSYNIYDIGYHNYAMQYSLKDGRIFMAILGLIADKIHISIDLYISITLFLALLISNITVMILGKIIKKYKQPKNIFQEIIIILISYITIFNFMYLDNMYFVECIVMAISLLLFLVSANILVEKKNKYYIKSLILTILGVMFYQGTIGMFFTFVFLFTILKNKNNIKQMLIDFIQSGTIAVIGILIDLLIVKIIGFVLNMKQSRYGKITNIPKNIKYIFLSLPTIMKYTCELFPENALIIFLSILTVIVIIYQAKNLNKEDNTLYKYLAIVFITIASAFVVSLTTLTSFYSGRLRNSLGALVGIIFAFLYIETELLENKNKLSKITLITLITFSIINVFNYENLILKYKKLNVLEKQEVQKIDEYISQYEKKTGIKVTKIAKVVMENNKNITDTAINGYCSAIGVVNMFTNRNLKNVTITNEEKQKYLDNKNSETEYECIQDTLYVNIYNV